MKTTDIVILALVGFVAYKVYQRSTRKPKEDCRCKNKIDIKELSKDGYVFQELSDNFKPTPATDPQSSVAINMNQPLKRKWLDESVYRSYNTNQLATISPPRVKFY